MKQDPFVLERNLHAPAELVWQALTDNSKMKEWYFDLEQFKPEVGFEFEFSAGSDEKKYLHRCKITEVIPGKKLTYSWSYKGYSGESFVTFELFPEGENTRLKLTHAGLETFPVDNPDFAKENFVAGWTQIIGTSLKEYVEKSNSLQP